MVTSGTPTWEAFQCLLRTVLRGGVKHAEIFELGYGGGRGGYGGGEGYGGQCGHGGSGGYGVTAASPVTAVVGVTATVIMNPAVEVAITEVATAAVGASTELNRWLGADRRMKAVLSR